MKTQGEDGHLQIKEGSLKQSLPSWPSEGINCANSLLSDLSLQNCEKINLGSLSHPLSGTNIKRLMN